MPTSEAAVAGRRERNSLLQALEVFRRLEIPRSFHALILYLYVCENEGLNVSELAYVAGLQVATTARLVKVLAGDLPEEPLKDGHALFEFQTSPEDRRLKFVHLTERGRALREELEGIITACHPIGMGAL